MNPYRASIDLLDSENATTVSAVFGKPESFVRLVFRMKDAPGGVATITLSQESADQLARAILIASCAAKAMDVK